MISNALKCIGGWGSAPDSAGELTTLNKPSNGERNLSHHTFLVTPLFPKPVVPKLVRTVATLLNPDFPKAPSDKF